jgi:hypothetical protein
MSDSNGFKIRGLNPDSDRVSIQSNVQTTWMLTYKRWGLPKVYDVGMMQNELIIIKCQDGVATAEIEIEPLGDKAGAMIGSSSRKATVTMRVGQKYKWMLEPGEALTIRSQNIMYPKGPGAGLSV